jgi:TolB-like protein/DNA-binding winged helix-turn-helix (wHTH) protein
VTVGVYQFGEFELDTKRFELFRAGRSLKVERMPMELLILLASRNGQLVTREQIAEHLWPRDVFVDTEHGINSAIRKLRVVLRDDSDQPRYVQTVTGKGYRFIAPIAKVGDLPRGNVAASASDGIAEPTATAAAAAVLAPIVAAEAMPSSSDTRQPAESDRATWVRRRWWIAGLAAAVAIAIVVGIALRRYARNGHAAEPQISSVAVLPLDNLSGDAGQEYFADGMTDELTTMLAKISTLRVVSRTSAMQYKGAHRPLREIAQALGVDGILEGSVERADGKVHMTVQLIDARTDGHIWAESYDRAANDVVTLPMETAQDVAMRLNSRIAVKTAARYVNPEAHDSYLRGRYYWFGNQGKEAAEYFKKAIALQPDYALGWVGLSDYYGAAAVGGDLPPAEANPQAEIAAKRALQLDDSLSDAHISMAWVCLRRYDWNCADAESARSVELNPASAAAHHCRAWMLIPLNRMDEALNERKKAMDIDPYSWPFVLAQTLDENHAFDAAIGEARMRLGANQTNAALHSTLSAAYLHKGMEREAAEELETSLKLDNDKTGAAAVHDAFVRGGYSAVLRMQLDELKKRSKKEYVSPMALASDFGELHRKEETLHYLEEAYDERSPNLAWVQHSPEFDFLHTDERYRSLVQRIGLPPSY